MKSRIHNRNIVRLLILLLVAVVQLSFISQKEGFHMDELLSFELANAEFNPWIVPTQPQGRLAKLYQNEIQGDTFSETLGNVFRLIQDVVENRGESLIANYTADVYEEPVWIDRETFVDYVTVDEDDAFNYLSVYFNVKDDNHPPLHFMVLHTVSSLVQGKATPLMGCMINLATILGCCILLFRLGDLCGKERTGMMAALLYGLSCGGIATGLLIRMYGLMTFFCVALFYCHVSKWLQFAAADSEIQSQGDVYRKKNGWLIAVTLLGFWTQYFFLFYCLALAVVTAVLLLTRRAYRSLGYYVRSMATAAVIGLCVFPFAVSDVFSSDRGVEALGNLANGLSGYGARLAAFGEIVLESMLGNLSVGFLILAVTVLAGIIGLWRRRKEQGDVPTADTGNDDRLTQDADSKAQGLAWMFFVPPIVYFLAAARMSPYLVDRYVMALFPFAAMALALIISWSAGQMRGKAGRWVAVICAALLCVVNVCSYSGEYLYKGYQAQEQIAKENAGLSCICIYAGYGYYENLKEFMQYEETLLLTLEELQTRQDRSSILEKDQVMILLKKGVAEEALTILTEEYGMEIEEVFDVDSPYGDTLLIGSFDQTADDGQ